MKVNTGCGFLAAGLALWLLHGSQPGSGSFYLARALSLIVGIIQGLRRAASQQKQCLALQAGPTTVHRI